MNVFVASAGRPLSTSTVERNISGIYCRSDKDVNFSPISKNGAIFFPVSKSISFCSCCPRAAIGSCGMTLSMACRAGRRTVSFVCTGARNYGGTAPRMFLGFCRGLDGLILRIRPNGNLARRSLGGVAIAIGNRGAGTAFGLTSKAVSNRKGPASVGVGAARTNGLCRTVLLPARRTDQIVRFSLGGNCSTPFM